MPDFSLTLVLRLTTSKIINDVARVQIKSESITLFGAIFPVREEFSRFVGSVIDKVLGLRTCSSDTILRGISELATANTAYTSDTGRSYDFNTAAKLNSLHAFTQLYKGIVPIEKGHSPDTKGTMC